MVRRGLFVGINEYPAELGTLSSCLNDAVAMQAACIKFGLLDAAETTLMTSPASGRGAPPSRAAILDWLLPLYDADRPIDRLIVYLSGHGLSFRLGREADALRTVFVPAGLRSLRNSGGDLLDLDELVGRFRRRGAQDQIWIIDACRNTVEPRLDVATIGWDRPAPNDPREAKDNAQAVIFAVAPLAKAVADRNGHGRLTRHLLEGLACHGDASWGAAADYDEASDGWSITCASLVRYARRRVEQTLSAGDWRREYELPQLRVGETPPKPLRSVGIIPDRPFSVVVAPPEAAMQVSIAISARRRVLAAWPPMTVDQPAQLAPETYRVTASLMDATGKAIPPPFLESAIDVRETDHVEVHVLTPGAAPVPGSPKASDLLYDAAASAQAEPQIRKRVLKGARPQAGVHATIIVRVSDSAGSIRAVRLSGGAEVLYVNPGEPTAIAPGIWRLELRIGAELASSSTHDFEAGGEYAISPRVAITPAIAALIGEDVRGADDREGPFALSLGDVTGPMQGAVLATLLPLAALRAFDREGMIPTTVAPAMGEVGTLERDDVVIALALEGGWSEVSRKTLLDTLAAPGAARRIWAEMSERVALLAIPARDAKVELVLPLPGRRLLRAPAVSAGGCAAIVTVTLWPDRAAEVGLALVPVLDGLKQATRAARARAVLARMLEPGGEHGRGGLAWSQAAKTADDAILSVLAWWWGRRRATSPDEAKMAQQAAGPALERFSALPDARVIKALESITPDASVDALLDDANLGAPALAQSVAVLARRALARGLVRHWAAERFQNLGDRVFNVIDDSSRQEGEPP